MALPQRLNDAEIRLWEADDDLRAALAHGNPEEKRAARDAYRAAVRERQEAVKEALAEREVGGTSG